MVAVAVTTTVGESRSRSASQDGVARTCPSSHATSTTVRRGRVLGVVGTGTSAQVVRTRAGRSTRTASRVPCSQPLVVSAELGGGCGRQTGGGDAGALHDPAAGRGGQRQRERGRPGAAGGADHRQDRLGRVPPGTTAGSGWVASEVPGHQGTVGAQQLVDADGAGHGAHRGPRSSWARRSCRTARRSTTSHSARRA